MTEKAAPHGSSTTANRPYGESCAGISVFPPALSTAATAASAEATAKHVDQPGIGTVPQGCAGFQETAHELGVTAPLPARAQRVGTPTARGVA